MRVRALGIRKMPRTLPVRTDMILNTELAQLVPISLISSKFYLIINIIKV
jgi:hypothetical protein